MRRLLASLLLLLVAGCAHDGASAAYLRPSTHRTAVIASLDDDLCAGRMRVIEDSSPYWVGLCQNRRAFEDRVFFMAFDSRGDRDHYLERLESCFARGRYVEGPRWFAMAVTSSDAATLRQGGGTTVHCGG